MATLTVALQNRTGSGNVFAFITGRAIDSGNALFLLQADARSPYFPGSPSSPGAKLAVNCAIRLGPPGNTVNATIPHIAGGRIWFSIDQPLTFLLNPGPGLVEPAVTNPADPNININWAFAEFTWNAAQMFANISYVDFVSLPVSLSLSSRANSTVQNVVGMAPNGLDLVCDRLRQQNAADGAGWDQLIVRSPSGGNLRALSPNNGMTLNPSLFRNYYNPYVDAVYSRLTTKSLGIDTQAQWGIVRSTPPNHYPESDFLNFGTDATTNTPLRFGKPSARDIFSCSTGPFTPSPSIEKGALIARLAAAFNRSSLLEEDVTPSEPKERYYSDRITNHYSRIVHSVNVEGRGYAFPFDDVAPTGGVDQSGAVQDGAPGVLTVGIGGSGGAARELNVQS